MQFGAYCAELRDGAGRTAQIGRIERTAAGAILGTSDSVVSLAKSSRRRPIWAKPPAAPIDRIEPLEPMDRIEPADPTDRMEPTDPTERNDPTDNSEPAEKIELTER